MNYCESKELTLDDVLGEDDEGTPNTEKTKKTARSKITLREYFAVTQGLRKITNLTKSEILVLNWIFDRTYGWKKRREAMSLRQMSLGMVNWETKEQLAQPIGDIKTVGKAFNLLVEKGLVVVEGRNDMDRMIVRLNTEGTLDYTMKIPKRHRKTPHGKTDTTPWENSFDPMGNRPHKDDRREDEKKEEARRIPASRRGRSEEEDDESHHLPSTEDVPSPPSPPPLQTAREVAEEVMARVRAKGAEKRASKLKGVGRCPTKAQIETIWREAHLSAPRAEGQRPSIAPLGKVGAAVMWNYAKDWTSRNPGQRFGDYLTFVVHRWDTIKEGRLAWVDPEPLVPNSRLIAGGKTQFIFENAWRERMQIEAEARMTPAQRRIEMNVQRGMDRRAAEEYEAATCLAPKVDVKKAAKATALAEADARRREQEARIRSGQPLAQITPAEHTDLDQDFTFQEWE